MAGKNGTRKGKLSCLLGESRAESERGHVGISEPDGTLAGKPQPRSNTQIKIWMEKFRRNT